MIFFINDVMVDVIEIALVWGQMQRIQLKLPHEHNVN